MAVAMFGVLAMLPAILPALHLDLHPAAPSTRHDVTRIAAPPSPQPVRVPRVAQAIDPGLATATRTTANAAREAAVVTAEDSRLRVLLHDAFQLHNPFRYNPQVEVIGVKGSLPTLVMTAGPSTYTAATLVQYGALVMLPHNAALLVDNVYVAAHASLSLGGSGLRTLYLNSGRGGFATIVAWGGNLTFAGTAAQPLTIMGWDRAKSAPAADLGYGRAYIREAGGQMTLTNVRATSLGFWSGRTGGVAWTGLKGEPSTGGATSSTFIGDTYGAFVSRGFGVTFRGDLFEFNGLDGLHIHRYSKDTTVTASSAARNGGSGFVVSSSTQNTLLAGDIAEHNNADGFFLNGRPLATGASASGGSVLPGSRATIQDSAALNNGKNGILVEGGTETVIKSNQVCAALTAVSVRSNAVNTVITGNTVGCRPRYGKNGILVEGGMGTVIKSNQVCAASTAVSVRSNAVNTVVAGNTVGCRPRSGIAVGPSAPGTSLSGNAVSGARTAFLIRAAGPVEFNRNLVTDAKVFGVSARGAASMVTGAGNTIAGNGFRAVDARQGALMPALYATNTANWVFHPRVTFVTYIQFHPLAAMWLGMVLLILLAWLWSRRHRMPSHPYPYSTRWNGSESSVVLAAAREIIAVPAAVEDSALLAAATRESITAPAAVKEISAAPAAAEETSAAPAAAQESSAAPAAAQETAETEEAEVTAETVETEETGESIAIPAAAEEIIALLAAVEELRAGLPLPRRPIAVGFQSAAADADGRPPTSTEPEPEREPEPEEQVLSELDWTPGTARPPAADSQPPWPAAPMPARSKQEIADHALRVSSTWTRRADQP